MAIHEHAKPNIFEYDDYRIYLGDLYAHFKTTQPKEFSHRALAAKLGFKSSSFFKSILDGQRNLKNGAVLKVCEVFGLNKKETQFFEELVHYNQATDSKDQAKRAEQILKNPHFKKVHPLSQAESNAYSNWYYYAIREMVNMAGFIDDPFWISQQLEPQISEIEAKRALKDLTDLGLLIRDENGQLKSADAVVTTTPKTIVSSMAKGFHRQMLERASESLDKFEKQDREISATTLGLSDEAMREMRLEFLKFREKLHEIAQKDADNKVEKVVQLNFQLFPLLKKKKASGGDG